MESEQVAYVDKVAGLLLQRPELRVRFCGVSTRADQAALAAAAAAPDAAGADDASAETPEAARQPTLRELAEARARNVKARLVREHKVPASQLFLCAPEIREDDDLPPSVKLRV